MLIRKLVWSTGALLVLAAVLGGCGNSADTTDGSGNFAGVTAAAVVGGAVQGSDSGATAFLYPAPKPGLWDMTRDLFQEKEAYAAVCSSSNESCASGVVTVAFDGCTSKNGRTTFTGGYTLTLGGTSASCPGSGFWLHFFTTNGATLFRTFTEGTSLSNVDGVSVSTNNISPVGWDSAVTLTKDTTYNKYGMLRTNVSHGSGTSSQTLFNSGVQYVATGTQKKKTATLWDHTISFAGSGLDVTHTFGGAADTKVVSSHDATSFVIVQHNVAQWTGHAILTNVTYKHGTDNYCGCYPVIGNDRHDPHRRESRFREGDV